MIEVSPLVLLVFLLLGVIIGMVLNRPRYPYIG